MKKETETVETTEPVKTDSEKIEQFVAEYFTKHQESPFKDFQVKEDDQMAVDMDANFEETITSEFGDRASVVLGEYISGLIRGLIDNLDEDELQELKEQDECKDECKEDECQGENCKKDK